MKHVKNLKAKYDYQRQWHRMYAWAPKRLTTEDGTVAWVWFEYYWRRSVDFNFRGWYTYPIYEYKLDEGGHAHEHQN